MREVINAETVQGVPGNQVTGNPTAWYKRGVDVQSMLPALYAYMGFMGLNTTQRYLTMTPERLRLQLSKLSSPRSNRCWRGPLPA